MTLQGDMCDVAVGEVGVLMIGRFEAGPFDADVFRFSLFEIGMSENGICDACEYCLKAAWGSAQGTDVFETDMVEPGLFLLCLVIMRLYVHTTEMLRRT